MTTHLLSKLTISILILAILSNYKLITQNLSYLKIQMMFVCICVDYTIEVFSIFGVLSEDNVAMMRVIYFLIMHCVSKKAQIEAHEKRADIIQQDL